VTCPCSVSLESKSSHRFICKLAISSMQYSRKMVSILAVKFTCGHKYDTTYIDLGSRRKLTMSLEDRMGAIPRAIFSCLLCEGMPLYKNYLGKHYRVISPRNYPGREGSYLEVRGNSFNENSVSPE